MRTLVLATMLAIIGAAVALAGSAPAAAPASSPASLGHLQTREHVVTIHAGTTATYTVRDKHGKILAGNISCRQLRAQFPKLARIVERGLAPSSACNNLNASERPVVDAGLR